MKRKIGAPKGGRVHWLLWHLPTDFKGAYNLYYDYSVHNYIFVRYSGRLLYDVFIVAQTSKHYWKCTYANVQKQKYEFFGDNTTRRIARRMWYIWRIDDEFG